MGGACRIRESLTPFPPMLGGLFFFFPQAGIFCKKWDEGAQKEGGGEWEPDAGEGHFENSSYLCRAEWGSLLKLVSPARSRSAGLRVLVVVGVGTARLPTRRVPGPRECGEGCVLHLPCHCFCLTFLLPPPNTTPPPRGKSVCGAQISPLKKLRRILETSTSRIAGLLDLNLRS